MMKKIIERIKTNRKIVHGSIIWGVTAAFFLLLSLKLLFESRYYAATGTTIIFLIMLFAISLLFINPERHSIDKIVREVRKDWKARNGKLLNVFTTKDRLLVMHIIKLLNESGIKCFVFNENASAMMNFIDGISMQIHVKKDDYDQSLKIIESALSQREGNV